MRVIFETFAGSTREFHGPMKMKATELNLNPKPQTLNPQP